MMLQSRVAMVTGRGRLTLIGQEVPEAVPGGIVADVLRAGICGTDLHLLDDPQPIPGVAEPYPIAMGHEMVVRIRSINAGAVDSYGLAVGPGDRVVFDPTSWACGRCYACRVLLSPNNCLHPQPETDFPEFGAAFADHVTIPPGSLLFRVPDGMPDEIAVLTEPMAGASRAFQRAARPGNPDRGEGFGIGSNVVIQGAGAIGALLTVLAKAAGAGHITVIGEPAGRRELCLALGADLALGLDGTASDRVAEVAAVSPLGLGADVVFEASGAPSALGEAIAMARIEGTIVEFGAYTARGASTVEASAICRKDLTILGSHGYGPGQFGLALRLLERWRGEVDLAALVTHTVPLDRLAEGFAAARSGEAVKATVVP